MTKWPIISRLLLLLLLGQNISSENVIPKREGKSQSPGKLLVLVGKDEEPRGILSPNREDEPGSDEKGANHPPKLTMRMAHRRPNNRRRKKYPPKGTPLSLSGDTDRDHSIDISALAKEYLMKKIRQQMGDDRAKRGSKFVVGILDPQNNLQILKFSFLDKKNGSSPPEKKPKGFSYILGDQAASESDRVWGSNPIPHEPPQDGNQLQPLQSPSDETSKLPPMLPPEKYPLIPSLEYQHQKQHFRPKESDHHHQQLQHHLPQENDHQHLVPDQLQSGPDEIFHHQGHPVIIGSDHPHFAPLEGAPEEIVQSHNSKEIPQEPPVKDIFQQHQEALNLVHPEKGPGKEEGTVHLAEVPSSSNPVREPPQGESFAYGFSFSYDQAREGGGGEANGPRRKLGLRHHKKIPFVDRHAKEEVRLCVFANLL